MVVIKCFARFREEFGDELSMEASTDLRVADCWNYISNHAPVPERILCAVNQVYCSWNDKVENGDEVAFFPPVTGG